MMEKESDVPTFRTKIDGCLYTPRPGAYAVILDGNGHVAVVKTSLGHYLPGGGLETGENHEEALDREVREECALEVDVLYKIGSADQFVSGRSGSFRKQCVFFRAKPTGNPCAGGEDDHELHWLACQDAQEALSEACQSWALQQVLRVRERLSQTG